MRKIKNRSDHAFSLTELIGVLAILAILASFMLPSVIRTIEQAYQDKEHEDLVVIGKALEQGILRTKTIPKDGWSDLVAEELSTPLSRVTVSGTGFPRVFVVDPGLHIGSGSPPLPYTQDAQGSTQAPENLRLMVISSHRLALPDAISVPSMNSETFNAIWSTPAGQVPPGWPKLWAGHGDRLFIFRLDLSPHFCRLVINNLCPDRNVAISVGQDGPISIPGEGWDSYYLKGTLIGFYNDGLLEARDLLSDSRSYVYERGTWRGIVRDGKFNQSDFVKALEGFQNARLNQASPPGIDQAAVVNAYQQFALSYSSWAKAGFPSEDSPEYSAVSQSRTRLQLVARSLISQ